MLRLALTGLWLLGCTPAAAPPSGQPGLILTDDLGRAVRLAGPARRVLSLAPSNTEWMYALGAEGLLVGRSDRCDFPAAVTAVPSVGGLFPPDHERILLTRPDLVLMIEGHARLRADLEARGIAVLVLQPRSFAGALHDLRLLGRAVGRAPAAEALARQLAAEARRLEGVVSQRRRTFYEVWHDPLTGAGPQTFVGDLLRRAGADNVLDPAAGPWPRPALETVVLARPEVIIAASADSAARVVAGRRPGLSATPAARAGRVYHVPDPDWLARPGPRMIRGLAWLVEVIGR